MDLPPEIRVLIYENLLVSNAPLYIRPRRINFEVVPAIVRGDADRESLVYPPILRTSKMICAEALPLLYSENIFQFDCTWPITSMYGKFLSQIGSHTLDIRQIFFAYDQLLFQDPLTNHTIRDFEKFSSLVSGVKVVEFRFFAKSFISVDYVLVLRFLRPINALIRKAGTVEKIIIRRWPLYCPKVSQKNYKPWDLLSFKEQLGHELEASILGMGWIIADSD
jgi:hypothetical protein